MFRFLVPLVVLIGLAVPAAAVDVTADDTVDEYVISGAVVLNAGFPEAREAAGCSNCHWRIVRICTAGSLDERRGCDQLPNDCTADRAEVWRADAEVAPPVGDPLWQYRGITCLDDPPVSAAPVVAAVPELARQAVPELQPGSRPPHTTLTNLPTAFFSGQSGAIDPPAMTVAGARVRLHLRPIWTWDFGHGTPTITAAPGSPVRTSAVQHRFPRRGIYRVRVQCTWHATYELNGIPGFVVDDLHQTGWFDLRVKEARRFLTTNRRNT